MIQRRDTAIAVVLTIVTCGIYGLYWLVCLVDDNNALFQSTETPSGIKVLLLSLITCGIYGYVWIYKAGSMLDEGRIQNGQPNGNLALLYLLLSIFGLSIVAFALMQTEHNKYAPMQ